MSFIIYMTSISLIIHSSHSYILLTANLDDLHSIAKELAQSPVADQIGGIIRRAYDQFQKMDFSHTRNFQPRAEPDDKGNRRQINDPEAREDDEITENKREDRENKGKENYYIKSINKVLDNVK